MDIMAKFNLPKYVKGKTFAEASAIIAKKFKDNNNPESIATLNELQDRLKQAQEFVKAEQEARTKPKQAATEAQASGLNEGADAPASEPASNKYNKGGGLFSKLFGGGAGAGAATSGAEGAAGVAGGGGPGVGGYMQAATGAIDIAKDMFGKSSVDTSGATDGPDVDVAGQALGGAMKGASAGMAFGPVGGAIGGVLGGVGGLISGGKDKKAAKEASFQFDTGNHNRAVNRYESGGKLLANMFEGGDDLDTEERPKAKVLENTLKASGVQDVVDVKAMLDESAKNGMDEFMASQKMAKEPNLNRVASKEKFNPMELLRYAPAAMNLTQLAGLKKPDEVGLDRLGNKYNEQLVDERGLQNQVQEGTANVRNAILSSSGGSGSSARANLLASQLQGQKAMSNAYMQATEANRQENRRGQQFDLGVDQTNLGQSNQETNLNLEQQAGYQTNKSKLMSQLGNDLGGIGQEELLKRYPELMGLSYGSKGQHFKSEADRKALNKAKRKYKRSQNN